MTEIIYNSLQDPLLDTIALNDPLFIEGVVANRINTTQVPIVAAYTKTVADQMNSQRMGASPPMRAPDLQDHIADIIIETTAQGASLLEVHVIDPYWTLLQRDARTGVSFIDVDDSGLLWPPIEIQFPPDKSDAVWRLCQCKPSTDLGQSNITLVFEDKIVSVLREHDNSTTSRDSSVAQSTPNETRAEYIRRIVEAASGNPVNFDPASDIVIRFWPLLDPTDFTPADLAPSEASLPFSVTALNTDRGQSTAHHTTGSAGATGNTNTLPSGPKGTTPSAGPTGNAPAAGPTGNTGSAGPVNIFLAGGPVQTTGPGGPGT